MKVFRLRDSEVEVVQWCWHYIGMGGEALKTVLGCELPDDWWSTDLWKIQTFLGKREIVIKEDSDATMFALRWR